MSTLQFPASPFPGQSFTAENGVTYTYDSAGGGGWTANNPIGIDNEYVEVAGDNMTGNLTLGTDKITLNAADGSATFASSQTLGSIGNPSGNGYTALIDNDESTTAAGFTSNNLNSDGISFLGVNGSDGNKITFMAKNDGYLTVTGDIEIGGTGRAGSRPANPKTVLNADGSAEFASYVRSNEGFTVYPPNDANFAFATRNAADDAWGAIIYADGSSYFDKYVNVGPNTGTTTQDLVGNSVSNGAFLAYIASTTPSNAYVWRALKTNAAGSFDSSWITAKGDAFFKGNVSADGTIGFNLEADDDTKYTSTTDADGNVTRVYNGETLDLKEVGLALVALKAAAANATDFASLKSAIATSLANL